MPPTAGADKAFTNISRKPLLTMLRAQNCESGHAQEPVTGGVTAARRARSALIGPPETMQSPDPVTPQVLRSQTRGRGEHGYFAESASRLREGSVASAGTDVYSWRKSRCSSRQW